MNILTRKGNMGTLADYKVRTSKNSKLGFKSSDCTIDKVHQAMHLYSTGNRKKLLEYINKQNISNDHPVWRLLNSLCEVLPSDTNDYKDGIGLITNKETLIRDAKNILKATGEQVNMDFE